MSIKQLTFKPLHVLGLVITVLAAASCANAPNPLEGYEQVEPAAIPDSPEVSPAEYPAEQVERGRYMVGLLGCGNCHTDGALIGEPDTGRVLAGSEVGIAWSNPLEERNPGVVFPANLTPDPKTGLGEWTLDQVVEMLQSGIDNHGGQSSPVMPWAAYSRLLPEDARAIAMYLKSLQPVSHQVPANVRPGQKTSAPFIHFGVYRKSK